MNTKVSLVDSQQPSLVSHFGERESEVRFYSRDFEVEFDSGLGGYIQDSSGRRWIDFLSAAGALNYGHNPQPMQKALLEYIGNNGVVTSLDMFTKAKSEFIESFDRHILKPRKLAYKYQFCGPTGTNCIEAAIKLARKVTSRQHVVAFSNSFHGMTAGSMNISAGQVSKGRGYLHTSDVTFLPFSGQLDNDIEVMRLMLTQSGSGVPKPACIVLETIQGEGGINIARQDWLQAVAEVCSEIGALLVIDDIQMGCGRTGGFFSFEHYGIQPDIVCLSKSLSGYGLPMSLLLLRSELDCWDAGEHNGTFRGFNYAFVTAKAAIEHYWAQPDFQVGMRRAENIFQDNLGVLVNVCDAAIQEIRSKGFVAGIELVDQVDPKQVVHQCFEQGLLLETCGPYGKVVKLLPPITMTEEQMVKGFSILRGVLSGLVR